MINPIQPNTQSTTIPMDTFSGQKMERSQETPRPVVDRKQEIPSAREEIPREEVEKAAEKLNRLMGIIDKRLEFRVDEKSQRVVVKIIDQQNGELLDEIPSQRALDILNSFRDMIGLLFDKQV
ncbi:flagellar protein FlaG [Desulfosporosinus sp. OT]|uniref:flagellar protein FlaG n=1 Tax=Desulfosporosinus sp. OT TaxID=913865 RepID=UPI000223B2C9|nr:flagellar protein FlaG [Desulfosporosinus sp. OT]EGW36788.1 flaG family protein [Desulfosporosinus sp. OT]